MRFTEAIKGAAVVAKRLPQFRVKLHGSQQRVPNVALTPI
jgi:hypothetical protein